MLGNLILCAWITPVKLIKTGFEFVLTLYLLLCFLTNVLIFTCSLQMDCHQIQTRCGRMFLFPRLLLSLSPFAMAVATPLME